MIMLGMGISSVSGNTARNWSEVAFPSALMQPSIPGHAFDPAHPLNTVTSAGGGGAPVLGGPVGRVQGYSPDLTDVNAQQATDALRPTLVNKGGKLCFLFNGTDQFLSNSGFVPGNWESPPKTITMFGMFWRDAAVPASDQHPCAMNRGEVADSYIRPFGVSTSGVRGNVDMGAANFVTNLVGLATYPVGQWVEVISELTVTESAVAGVGTQSGTLKYWVNDLPVVTHDILPDRSATANVTNMTRYTIGARHSSVTPAGFWEGAVGRNGWLNRALDDTQRGLLRNWMRGTTYIAP